MKGSCCIQNIIFLYCIESMIAMRDGAPEGSGGNE